MRLTRHLARQRSSSRSSRDRNGARLSFSSIERSSHAAPQSADCRAAFESHRRAMVSGRSGPAPSRSRTASRRCVPALLEVGLAQIRSQQAAARIVHDRALDLLTPRPEIPLLDLRQAQAQQGQRILALQLPARGGSSARRGHPAALPDPHSPARCPRARPLPARPPGAPPPVRRGSHHASGGSRRPAPAAAGCRARERPRLGLRPGRRPGPAPAGGRS